MHALDSSERIKLNILSSSNTPTWLRPKQNTVFRATRPYLSEPADPRLFFTKIPFFFVGVFIIEIKFLKKQNKKTRADPT